MNEYLRLWTSSLIAAHGGLAILLVLVLVSYASLCLHLPALSNKYATNWWKALRSPKPTPPHPPLCLPAFVLRGGAGQSSTPQFPSFVRAWNTNMISWGNKRGQRSKQLAYHYLWGRSEGTNFSYCFDMYGLLVICFQHCNTECNQLIAVQRLSSLEIYHSQSSTTLIEKKTFPVSMSDMSP